MTIFHFASYFPPFPQFLFSTFWSVSSGSISRDLVLCATFTFSFLLSLRAHAGDTDNMLNRLQLTCEVVESAIDDQRSFDCMMEHRTALGDIFSSQFSFFCGDFDAVWNEKTNVLFHFWRAWERKSSIRLDFNRRSIDSPKQFPKSIDKPRERWTKVNICSPKHFHRRLH